MQQIREGFWKTITVKKGYGNYLVSKFGNVLSLNFNNQGFAQVITPSIDKDGYLRVGLTINGKLKKESIHRLVALAWLDNPHNYEQVNHIDPNKYNVLYNDVSNIEWCSHQQNHDHAKRLGLYKPAKGEKHCRSKITEAIVIEIFRLYNVEKWSQQRIADHFGIGQPQVSYILTRKQWSTLPIPDLYL